MAKRALDPFAEGMLKKLLIDLIDFVVDRRH